MVSKSEKFVFAEKNAAFTIGFFLHFKTETIQINARLLAFYCSQHRFHHSNECFFEKRIRVKLHYLYTYFKFKTIKTLYDLFQPETATQKQNKGEILREEFKKILGCCFVS